MMPIFGTEQALLCYSAQLDLPMMVALYVTVSVFPPSSLTQNSNLKLHKIPIENESLNDPLKTHLLLIVTTLSL